MKEVLSIGGGVLHPLARGRAHQKVLLTSWLRVFFTHSTVDGHSGCFHVLAIVNSAATNMEANVFFQIMVFFGYMTRSWIAGHNALLMC